jgi:hypothetical protein
MKPMAMLVCVLVMTLVSGERLQQHSSDYIALKRHQNVQSSGGPLSNAWGTVGNLAIIAGVVAIGVGAYKGVKSLMGYQKGSDGANAGETAEGAPEEAVEGTAKGNT